MWACSHLHVIAILFFPPPISTRFRKEEEKEWINRRRPLRIALSLELDKGVSIRNRCNTSAHTHDRAEFIMYRLHIQDRHHLRALVKDCNTLKHLEDTPYRQTLRKFDQNASLFLCWLAPLIR